MQITVRDAGNGDLEVEPYLAEGYAPEALIDVLGQYLAEISIREEDRAPGWGRP